MKYLKTFETYTFEDFTHVDIEDVKELLPKNWLKEGLDIEQIDRIATELDFSLNKVKQILDSIRKNQQMFNESRIHIPTHYSGVRMELGLEDSDDANSDDIISLYNQLVEEGTPLVSYSEYGTEGKFYNEDDDEIPTDAILDELNYAIGLDGGELEGLDESKKSGVSASLKKKSQASGIPMGILRKVFAKGMQAMERRTQTGCFSTSVGFWKSKFIYHWCWWC